MEEENVGGDSMISDFATYEDFLDSQITVADLFYLEVSVFCQFWNWTTRFSCYLSIAIFNRKFQK